VAKEQGYLTPKKSNFNRIIGDSRFELLFARSLEDCVDVASHAKDYLAVHFKLDYVDGDISNYYPDFPVKLLNKRSWLSKPKDRKPRVVAPVKSGALRRSAARCLRGDMRSSRFEASRRGSGDFGWMAVSYWEQTENILKVVCDPKKTATTGAAGLEGR
jgi:hypothetical protein